MTHATTTPASRSPRRDSPLAQVIALIVMVGIPLLVSFLGSRATDPHSDGWYEQAEKAPWNPPDWVFGPVWIVLYIVMGIAAWLIWRRRHQHPATLALTLYFLQLAVNGLWTPIFFAGYPTWGTAALWAAMGIITTLTLLLIFTIRAFWPISRLAALLLVPYLGWVLYAASLNAYIAAAN
ncbi:TspO/MBR family protein [Nesterenkonia flava]|uniref:TspO/MBR family protein n=1 Tax=Nesterenkonia flava TaxID=469799 RepID=A0ABU1FR64_9MICC|nr:TspO/MBR family protein [Nesterenkonia flava]MDR5711144.1 TspO/MBR family protein [Nesterenkonia flava]